LFEIGGLIHIIWIEQGPERAKLFLNQTQRVINYWLLQRAYTIGVSDTIADMGTISEISGIIEQAKQKVDEFIIQLYRNELKRKPGMTLMATFENHVNKELNQGVDDAGNKAMQSLSRANNINTMVNSGSKGQTVNISQIMACVGQQNVEVRAFYCCLFVCFVCFVCLFVCLLFFFPLLPSSFFFFFLSSFFFC